MRQLILLRGPMGAGKSTWIRQMGLEAYTISPDKIREMISGPVMNADGMLNIDGKNEAKVWDFLNEMLKKRMEIGAFTVIDATHAKSSSFRMYKELCQRYRYRAYVVEFDVSLECALKQNEQRDEYKVVPVDVVKNAHIRMRTEKVPSWVKKTNPMRFSEDVMWKKIDYTDKFKNVAVIGDIHGCLDALKQTLKDINKDDTSELNDDTLYVFTGDYLDRGTQNADTFKFMNKIVEQPNVICLQGNHEEHLINWSLDEKTHRGFLHSTAKDLETAGVTTADARQFTRKLQQVLHFEFHGQDYLVSHGGVTTAQIPLSLIPSSQFINGVGSYELNVDKVFNENEKDLGAIQIHGHRNLFRLGVNEYNRSYNLEGQVERGGHLRAVCLTKNEKRIIETRNESFNENPNVKNHVTSEEQTTIEKFMSEARNHRAIKITSAGNNIEAINFTRKAFTKKIWDEMTVQARGIFVNEKEGYVAARSYNKFFNAEERFETQSRYLVDKLSFPVTVYRKENGFLGLISYDKGTSELRFYSKSTSSLMNGADHAQLVERTARKLFTETQLNQIKQVSKGMNATFVFEVICPKEDPHITFYDDNQMVLLDIIENELIHVRKSYETVSEIAESIGVNIKKKEFVFNNWKDYYLWFTSIKDDLTVKHEGYVVEDANGHMFKIKTPYYISWKKLRGMLPRLARGEVPLINHSIFYRDFESAFVYWCSTQSTDYLLKESFLEIRRKFYEETKI